MDPRRILRHALAAALAVVLTVSGTTAPADAAPRKTSTTLKVSHTSIRKGEMVWLKGKVKTRSGKAAKGVKVRLERKAPGGSWKRFATLKTRSDGSFSQRQRPAKSYTYRARSVKSNYCIPKIVIGENRTFRGPEDYVRSRGVTIEIADDPECVKLMEEFIRSKPELWNEDIGE